jgi:hypothetical protein
VPTPTAQDHRAVPYTIDGPSKQRRLSLLGFARMWPTPDAGAFNLEEPAESWLARREKLKQKGINGNGAGMPLGIAVKLWPTPAARDYRHPNAKSYAERGGGSKGEQLPNAVGGALNPTWVEWLMGFPLGWTDFGPWGMLKSPSKPRRRSKSSGDD